jgi:hypothetical protein
MLATVMALCNAAGLITPLLYGRRTREVLRKKLAVLLAAVMMLVVSAAPALAHHQVGHDNHGNKGNDGADANQGGGQEHIRQDHPPHGGGDQHGGGSD